MTGLTAYAALFFSALVAATILPAQSEAVLVGLLLSGDFSTVGLLTSASIGNVLGALINYALGRGANRLADKRWFPASSQALNRGRSWYARYGWPSLLLSWVPIIGDPITVVAGIMREPLWRFVLLVTIAKVGRYLVIAGLTLGWMA